MDTNGPKPWRSALLGLLALSALSLAAVEPPAKQNEDVAASSLDGQGGGVDGSGLTLQEIDPETGEPIAVGADGEQVVSEGGTAGSEGTAGTAGTQGAGAKAGTAGGKAGTKGTAGAAGGATGGTAGTPGAGGGPGAGPQAACKAGQNGGKTDSKGVSGDRIKLAATNVRSGPGSSFLGSSYIGMQAAVNRVNAAGGVCGRLLDLRLVDDGWEAARGATFLQNFTQDDYFALPVVPSSEGLTQAIDSKIISSAGIPVVGTDGMLKEQYADPWVWPVAAATVTTMRVMTKHALGKGAKTFGVIYDQKYKFGLEGAEAFNKYVDDVTGKPPAAFVGIKPGQPNYAGDAQTFNAACEKVGGCDFVAMLLDPTTANTYIQSQVDKDGKRQGFGKMLTGGAQPLFNERFARDCGRPCDGMLVWTGYNPPTGRLASLPDVAQYVSDVKSVSPSVDVSNQFLEGSYLGMRVFLKALETSGPDLNRAKVREVMNSMTYSSDLSTPLSWKSSRFANSQAQPFRIQTTSGNFAGFAEEGSGFIPDPTPGVVPEKK